MIVMASPDAGGSMEAIALMNRMPAIFIGHGTPLNAVTRNDFTGGWAAVGKSIPRPKAILSVSAHYYIPFCTLTSSPAPATIHDFSGFPEALYRMTYPAPGSPALARRVKELLAPHPVRFDEQWGLDHGTWSVLAHMFPDADIPVVQLSIDETRPPGYHYETGARLAALREEGVLILVHKKARPWWPGSYFSFTWKNQSVILLCPVLPPSSGPAETVRPAGHG